MQDIEEKETTISTSSVESPAQLDPLTLDALLQYKDLSEDVATLRVQRETLRIRSTSHRVDLNQLFQNPNPSLSSSSPEESVIKNSEGLEETNLLHSENEIPIPISVQEEIEIFNLAIKEKEIQLKELKKEHPQLTAEFDFLKEEVDMAASAAEVAMQRNHSQKLAITQNQNEILNLKERISKTRQERETLEHTVNELKLLLDQLANVTQKKELEVKIGLVEGMLTQQTQQAQQQEALISEAEDVIRQGEAEIIKNLDEASSKIMGVSTGDLSKSASASRNGSRQNLRSTISSSSLGNVAAIPPPSFEDSTSVTESVKVKLSKPSTAHLIISEEARRAVCNPNLEQVNVTTPVKVSEVLSKFEAIALATNSTNPVPSIQDPISFISSVSQPAPKQSLASLLAKPSPSSTTFAPLPSAIQLESSSFTLSTSDLSTPSMSPKTARSYAERHTSKTPTTPRKEMSASPFGPKTPVIIRKDLTSNLKPFTPSSVTSPVSPLTPTPILPKATMEALNQSKKAALTQLLSGDYDRADRFSKPSYLSNLDGDAALEAKRLVDEKVKAGTNMEELNFKEKMLRFAALNAKE